MCTLDIILTICLSAALIQGIIKGFTEQVIALVAIIAGTWTAYKFTGLVCSMVQPYLNMSDRILHVIVFILMIVAVILVLHLLGKIIKASIDFVMLGWLDKLLGGIFAVLKAALILGILIILFNTLNSAFNIVPKSAIDDSVLYRTLKRVAYTVFPYFKELLFKQ